MRKFLLGVLLLPVLALAEQDPVEVNKKVVCDKASEMFPYIDKKYGETPIWIGQADQGKFSVLINLDTQTWSIVQYDLEKDISCLIDSGTGFKFKLPNML